MKCVMEELSWTVSGCCANRRRCSVPQRCSQPHNSIWLQVCAIYTHSGRIRLQTWFFKPSLEEVQPLNREGVAQCPVDWLLAGILLQVGRGMKQEQAARNLQKACKWNSKIPRIRSYPKSLGAIHYSWMPYDLSFSNRKPKLGPER